jgi:hypothetical protein
MEHSAAAAVSVVATLVLAYSIVFLAIMAFMIWAVWRIFAKAGFNGALSLLQFVPIVGHLICLIILAFGRWPVEHQLAAVQRPVSPTNPQAPPGTSVMPTS